MTTRILTVAALFTTFIPAIAFAQKPPTAQVTSPQYTQIATPPAPIYLPAPAAPVYVQAPAPVYAPAAPVYVQPAPVYAPPAPAYAPAPVYAPPTVAPPAYAQPTTSPQPAPAAPASAPNVETERGEFRYILEGGIDLWDVGGQGDYLPVAQLNGFFGWTLTNGVTRPDGRRALGVDLGFAIRLGADSSAVITRTQIAAQFAAARLFVTFGMGLATLQPTEGGDPMAGFSIDSTAGYRFGRSFFMGLTLGLDVWSGGATIHRNGVTLGFSVD